jgi:hypothetical protein
MVRVCAVLAALVCILAAVQARDKRDPEGYIFREHSLIRPFSGDGCKDSI